MFNRMRLCRCWNSGYYEHIEHPWQIRRSKAWTIVFYSYLFSLDRVQSLR